MGIRAILSLLFFLLAGAAAQGAEYPVKTVRMVVPFAAGGSTDLLARNIAQRLNETWKQPLLVEPPRGGGGFAAAQCDINPAPDAYTLRLGRVTPHRVPESLYSK